MLTHTKSGPRRVALTGALCACVLLALAACGSSTSEEPAARASSSSDTPATTSGSLDLTIDPTSAQAKCMVPNAEVLATQDTAFEGTVTEVADGTATLSVDTWYSGDGEADTVTVSTPSKQLQELLVAVDFQQGRTYLVSALDGRVSLCGFTAESNPQLEGLYADAFPG